MTKLELKVLYHNTCRVCGIKKDSIEFSKYYNPLKRLDTNGNTRLDPETEYYSTCNDCRKMIFAKKELISIIRDEIYKQIGYSGSIECDECKIKCKKICSCFDKEEDIRKRVNLMALKIINTDIIKLKSVILKYKEKINYFHYKNNQFKLLMR